MSGTVDLGALERLRGIFRRDKAAVCAQFSEWFYSYHADLFIHGIPFDVYIRKVQLIARSLEGAKRVLDVGAGFGVYACLLRILGMPNVVAMDYHAQKARDAACLVRHLGLDGVTVLQGDILAPAFPQGTFDASLALACLSHIREPGQALRNLALLLRSGGRLYVFEDNNSSYPGYLKQMAPIWEGAEEGTYADGVPPEKQQAESYRAMRRDLIRARYPDLTQEMLDVCARETRGLYGRHIIDAVGEFIRRGEFRNPRRHLVCHPLSGEFEEYPLNPSLVKRMLGDEGFSAQLRSPHAGPFSGKFRVLKALVARFLALCPAVLSWTSPTFAVVATLVPPPSRGPR